MVCIVCSSSFSEEFRVGVFHFLTFPPHIFLKLGCSARTASRVVASSLATCTPPPLSPPVPRSPLLPPKRKETGRLVVTLHLDLLETYLCGQPLSQRPPHLRPAQRVDAGCRSASDGLSGDGRAWNLRPSGPDSWSATSHGSGGPAGAGRGAGMEAVAEAGHTLVGQPAGHGEWGSEAG